MLATVTDQTRTANETGPARASRGRLVAYWVLEVASDLLFVAMLGLLGLTLWKLIYVAHGSAACTAPSPDMRPIIALGVAAVVAGAVGIGLGFAAISVKPSRRSRVRDITQGGAA